MPTYYKYYLVRAKVSQRAAWKKICKKVRRQFLFGCLDANGSIDFGIVQDSFWFCRCVSVIAAYRMFSQSSAISTVSPPASGAESGSEGEEFGLFLSNDDDELAVLLISLPLKPGQPRKITMLLKENTPGVVAATHQIKKKVKGDPILLVAKKNPAEANTRIKTLNI
jgi:hypothetical protein